MATAKQILGALNRAAEHAMGQSPADADARAGHFVAYFSGVLKALDEPAAGLALARVLGIEDQLPADGA